MNNVSFMHVLDSFANLSHVVDDFSFTHSIALSSDSFEEFPAGQTGIHAVH